MNRMSAMVINYFVKRNVIEEENKEIYEYGFKILISLNLQFVESNINSVELRVKV